MSAIGESGYKHFPEFFNETEVKSIRGMIDKKNVNYTLLSSFINGVFMKRVDSSMGWNSRYTKYRVSNNNNSSDASVFHRDVFRISNSEPEFKNMYTCLTYLDNATMQLVPKSHINDNMSLLDSLEDLANIITVEMKPGDVLIFNSTMLHRGVFDKLNMSDDRRLIQVFDTHPSQEHYKMYSGQVIHVKSTGIKSATGQITSYLGHVPVVSDLISYISYLNASTGYGRGETLDDILKSNKLEKYTFLSSEGMQKRMDPKDLRDGWGESNLYVLNDTPSNVSDMSDEVATSVLFQCYTKWISIYTILMLIILVTIVILLYNAGSYMLNSSSSASQKLNLVIRP